MTLNELLKKVIEGPSQDKSKEKDKAGLKKLFVCRHPTLGLRVGSVGPDFFLFW